MSDYYAEHPVMFKNNPLGFIVSLLLIPAFGIGLLILLWWYLQCKGAKLSVNDNDVLYEEGLLSKHRVEFRIAGIRTVRIKQSFLNRIFGVGSIHIYTAGDNPELIATGMPDPNRVRELIKARQNGGSDVRR